MRDLLHEKESKSPKLFQNKMGRKEMDRDIDEHTGQYLMIVEVRKYLGGYVYLL